MANEGNQDWVERGKVPEVLDAVTVPTGNETTKTRILCPYPKVAAFVGGNPDEASSFSCELDFGTRRPESQRVEL